MREKFIRFMNGRNGMDELARAESWVVMILLVVSIFTRSAILDILAIGLMIHMYFRVFSRNVSKRYAENQKFLNARYEWTVKAERRKKRFAHRALEELVLLPLCKAGGQGAKRTWQDLYNLSEVPGAVRETQLVHRKISFWLYDAE